MCALHQDQAEQDAQGLEEAQPDQPVRATDRQVSLRRVIVLRAAR
jgi:hypothetical protein